MRQIKNNGVDCSQIDSTRAFLRQKYGNKEEVNSKLWYELIAFVSEIKPNPRASSYEWESTIENYVN